MTSPVPPAKQCRVISWVLLALMLAITGWMSYGRAAAQAPEGGPQAPRAFSSGGTINFQGQLTTLAGAVLNGSYNLRFAIYDAPGAGTKRWPVSAYEEHPAVSVTGGLFSVQLGSISTAIDASVFNGGGDRYLQVWVCTTAGAGCTTYDDMGRLPISSTAYALHSLSTAPHDHFGETWTATGVGDGLRVENTAASGYAYGFTGQSASTSGRGVYGYASAASGPTYGVQGQSASTEGRGVYGLVTASSGSDSGVFGESASTAGRGVYGEVTAISGTTFGVYGVSHSSDGRGVVGLAAATSGSTRGVIGTVNSPDGTGVLGLALASSGQTNGVRGESASPSGRGV